MDWKTIRLLWWASIYDQYETQTDDVALLLSLLGEPKRVLEPCCGTGRLLIPLARAGHNMTGFDLDCGMLSRIEAKAAGLTGLRYEPADALTHDWGRGYDAVLLADNVIENLEQTGADYRSAQRRVIQKAADALRPGGHLYLVFDLYTAPARFFTGAGGEPGFYSGFDALGTYGSFVQGPSRYDAATRVASGTLYLDLRTASGACHRFEETWSKYVLPLEEATRWLDEAGFTLEHAWNDYHGAPLRRDVDGSAVLWACKR